MIDPIADMLNQIRNALAVGKIEISIPFSNLKQEIAGILTGEGFIVGAKKSPKNEKKVLKISLKYEQGVPAISGLKRVSKSGQRIYVGVKDMEAVKGNRGISIISTSKGLMTNKEARKAKLGGEVICEIW